MSSPVGRRYGGRVASSAPRPSLADDLRSWDDAALTRLLRARPDLARPAAADLTTLAARAVTPASVRRALDALDTPHLRVFEAVCVACGQARSASSTTTPEIGALLGTSPDRLADLPRLLDDLAALGLVQRDAETVALPIGLPVPGDIAGLAPPHADDEPIHVPTGADDDASVLAALTRSAPEGAVSILGALRWGPASGVVDLDGPLGEAVQWLENRGLLRPGPQGEVVLPRPVALALRRGRLWRDDPLTPPVVTPVRHDPAVIDAAGGAAAGELLSLVETIARAWGEAPPRVLRAGGLAVRDLTRTARVIDESTAVTGLIVEVMAAAGLVAQSHDTEPAWLPTDDHDTWLELPDEQRWARLVLAWRDMMRAPHRIGTRVPGGTGAVNALSSDVGWGVIPVLRRQVLGALAEMATGEGLSEPDARARVSWRAPRLDPRAADEVVPAVMSEATRLGLVSAGTLTAAGRALLADTDTPDIGADHVAAALALPAPVSEVVHQSDLTAIAPGRLSGAVAHILSLTADLESRGAAAVFRFTPASLRRAFDAGWSETDLLDTLRRIGATPVPQALEFLVHDVARTHGRARIGAAGAYLTSNDPAEIDAVLARPEAAAARLRRLAPTVAVTPLAPTHLVPLLRGIDVHALLESEDGTVVSGAAAPARTTSRRRRPVAAPGLSSSDLAEVVASLRAGEARRAANTPASSGPGTRGDRGGPADVAGAASDPAVITARLRDAAATGDAVWIGVADRDGRTTRYLIRPRHIGGGLVHGSPVPDDASSPAAGSGATTPPDRAGGDAPMGSWPLSRVTGVFDPTP